MLHILRRMRSFFMLLSPSAQNLCVFLCLFLSLKQLHLYKVSYCVRWLHVVLLAFRFVLVYQLMRFSRRICRLYQRICFFCLSQLWQVLCLNGQALCVLPMPACKVFVLSEVDVLSSFKIYRLPISLKMW